MMQSNHILHHTIIHITTHIRKCNGVYSEGRKKPGNPVETHIVYSNGYDLYFSCVHLNHQ